MSPSGAEYRQDKIDFMLEEREMKAKFRRGGGRTKGPAKRTQEDESKFRETLDKIVKREQTRNSAPSHVSESKMP